MDGLIGYEFQCWKTGGFGGFVVFCIRAAGKRFRVVRDQYIITYARKGPNSSQMQVESVSPHARPQAGLASL